MGPESSTTLPITSTSPPSTSQSGRWKIGVGAISPFTDTSLMATGNRYQPRHASRQFRPLLAKVSLLLAMLARGATALRAASLPATGLGRGFGRFG